MEAQKSDYLNQIAILNSSHHINEEKLQKEILELKCSLEKSNKQVYYFIKYYFILSTNYVHLCWMKNFQLLEKIILKKINSLLDMIRFTKQMLKYYFFHFFVLIVASN